MKYVNYAVETKVNKRNGLAMFLILLALIVFCLTFFMLRPKFTQTKIEYDKQVSTEKQIESLTSSVNNKKEHLNGETKKTNSELVKSQIVTEMGATAEKHSLSVDKLTSEDVKTVADSDLGSLTVNMELRGYLKDVQAFIADLDAREDVSHVSKMSYRLANQEFVWMHRAIDEDLAVSWLGSGNNPEEDEAEEEEALPSITVNDLLQHGVATCYIQVQFIGRA